MDASTDIVQTDAGPVRGTVTDRYRLFQGIPYAATTGGEGRWRPPRPVPPWREPRDATRPCPICPQQRALSDQLLRTWAGFARTGDPGGPGLPAWPRFDGAQAVPYVQSLAPGGDGIGPVDYAAEHHLGFWEATGPSPGLG